MGVMDRFLNYMKLNPDDENDDYGYDDDYEEEPEEKPRRSSVVKEIPEEEERKSSKVTPKVTPMRPARKIGTGANGMEVCVIRPTSVEDAREITTTLLDNRTVILNMEGLDVDVAQRIIDFTSGSCFAISGNLQKISHYIFIITPACVDISGDFQEIFAGSFEVPSTKNRL